METKLNQHIASRQLLANFPIVVLMSCVLAGCGGSDTGAGLLPTESNLSRLGALYSRCQYDSRGTPPANEQELRSYVEALPDVDFDGDLDELMKSKRDGESYVIFYGKDVIPTPIGDVIGYESKGVDGEFFVGYASGMVEAMDQASLEKLKK